MRTWTCAVGSAVARHLQVPAGVAEPALAGGLLAEVAVVEDGQVGAEHLGHRGHVAAHVGDDPDADLVGDVDERVGVDREPVDGAGRLGREGLDALGPAGDGQVVDAGLVEDRGHQRDVLLRVLDQGRVLAGVLVDGRADARVGVRDRRRDDVAVLEVAVDAGALGPALREERHVGTDDGVDLVLDPAQVDLAGGALDGRAQRPATVRSGGRSARRGSSASAARSAGGRGRDRASACTSASCPARRARRSRGAGRPRSRGARDPSAGPCRARAACRSGRPGCRS